MASLQALFGGTFDPIHYGHLQTVEALARQVGLRQVTLLPNNVPPHRPQPEASAAQRVAMVELAIADRPLFNLDTRELARQTPSWTVETLEQLRAERGAAQPLAFIIGGTLCSACINGIAGSRCLIFVICWSVSVPAMPAKCRRQSYSAG